MKILGMAGGFIFGVILFSLIFPRANLLQALLYGGGFGLALAGSFLRGSGERGAASAGQGELAMAVAALAGQDNSTAAARAQAVIGAFQAQAVSQQQAAEKRGEALPLGFVIASDAVARAIKANRALNEAAYAHYIKGRALEGAGRPADAAAAYRAGAQLSHARIWEDAAGWWSPAERARERLAELDVPVEPPAATAGAPLSGGHTKIPEGKKNYKCSACGWYVIPPDALACQHCGVSFGPAPRPPVPARPES